MNNNAFFEEELLELKFLGIGDSDIEKLSEVVNRYPVTYSVVKNMLICGLSINRIEEFCDICYNSEGFIIDMWYWYRRFLICGLIKED